MSGELGGRFCIIGSARAHKLTSSQGPELNFILFIYLAFGFWLLAFQRETVTGH